MRKFLIEFLNIFSPILLVALPFALPLYGFGFDVATILTIVSLFFAILLGFFFAAATSNYLRLQTLITDSNAGLVTLHNLAHLIDPTGAEKVTAAIDNYMISDLDFESLNYSMRTSKEFDELSNAVDVIEVSDARGTALIGNLFDRKESLRSVIAEISLATKTIIGRSHWVILATLSGLIAFLMLSLRDGGWVSTSMTAVVLYAIYLILSLLHSVDTNLFLARKLAFEDAQDVFTGIGRLPYYPAYAIERQLVPKPKGAYRIGRYKRPGSNEKDISVVEH